MHEAECKNSSEVLPLQQKSSEVLTLKDILQMYLFLFTFYRLRLYDLSLVPFSLQNEHRSHFWYQDSSRGPLDETPHLNLNTVLLLHFFFLSSSLLKHLKCCKSILFWTCPGEVAGSSSSKDLETDFDFSTCPLSFTTEIVIIQFFFPHKECIIFVVDLCLEKYHIQMIPTTQSVWSLFVPWCEMDVVGGTELFGKAGRSKKR